MTALIFVVQQHNIALKMFHRRFKKNIDGFLSIWFSNENTAVFLRIDQHTFLVVFMDTEPLNITQNKKVHLQSIMSANAFTSRKKKC